MHVFFFDESVRDIVYASVHHGNTEKVVKAIAEKHPEVELIDATKTILKDLDSYDLIGFASGVSSTENSIKLCSALLLTISRLIRKLLLSIPADRIPHHI